MRLNLFGEQNPFLLKIILDMEDKDGYTKN